MSLWEPGQAIVMREVWRGRVYSIFPVRVVQDSLTWTALCLPRQATGLFPHTQEGIVLRIPVEEWILKEDPWQGDDILYLVHAGLGYTFTAWWDDGHIFGGWKIDLVEPVRRTPLGFDYMDQLLDVIVSADRSSWTWKDEDEVQEALAKGLFREEQVHDLYRRGEHALHLIQSGEPPFDVDWEHWKSESAWQIPFELPPGWDRV
jgi:predicted RNA-binding protein associated with RNAse of E/G family